MNATPGYPADGVFIDEHDGGNISKMFPSAEYADYAAIQPQIVGMLQALKAGLGSGKMLMIGTAESDSKNTIDQVFAAGATHLEQMNNPMREMQYRWTVIDTMLGGNATVQLVTGLTNDEYNSADLAAQGWTAGSEANPAMRGRMFELASYYMVLTSPDKVYLTT